MWRSKSKRISWRSLIHLKKVHTHFSLISINRKLFFRLFLQSSLQHSGTKLVHKSMKWTTTWRGWCDENGFSPFDWGKKGEKCQAWKNRWNPLFYDASTHVKWIRLCRLLSTGGAVFALFSVRQLIKAGGWGKGVVLCLLKDLSEEIFAVINDDSGWSYWDCRCLLVCFIEMIFCRFPEISFNGTSCIMKMNLLWNVLRTN